MAELGFRGGCQEGSRSQGGLLSSLWSWLQIGGNGICLLWALIRTDETQQCKLQAQALCQGESSSPLRPGQDLMLP